MALAGLSSSMKWHAVSGILATCQRKSIERDAYLMKLRIFDRYVEFHELLF